MERAFWGRIGWIAVAGAVGMLARYGLSGLVQARLNGGFPWGTLAVNMLGCFLFGLAWSLAESRLLISAEVRTAVLIGFMGAFTTFSTFAFETTQRMIERQWGQVIINILAQNLVGIALMLLGIALGSRLGRIG